MKKLTFSLLLGILFISCIEKQNKETILEDDRLFEKATIQFLNPFITPSCIVNIDMQDSTITLHRLGSKSYNRFHSSTRTIEEIKNFDNIIYKLSSAEYHFFKKNFPFHQEDEKEKELDDNIDINSDNIRNSIFAISKDGTIIDIEINKTSDSQKIFFRRILSHLIKQITDSTDQANLRSFYTFYHLD